MLDTAWLFSVADAAAHELALFASVGFVIGGLGDLVIDFLWLGKKAASLIAPSQRNAPGSVTPAQQEKTRPLAIFVPAWDEANVIRPMLEHTLKCYGKHPARIFMGCYPNDPGTQTEAQAVADTSNRIDVVVCSRPGPTTKADCLNHLWLALRAHERRTGTTYQAVVLHDAEDLAHPGEAELFGRLMDDYALAQIPVIPLIDPDSRWISGHYCDEFAEAHGKNLPVRNLLGAGLPSAGVGCAINRDMLTKIAGERNGHPFSRNSLTEDYELGLRIAERGGRSIFARENDEHGEPIAVRAHFPSRIDTAIRQKTRWIMGIALSGWDRLGWSGGSVERWMRYRDRRAILSAIVLTAAYAVLLLAAILHLIGPLFGYSPQPMGPILALLLQINAVLLGWRLVMRAGFTTRCYGWREGLRAIPRTIVSNIIAIAAARRALTGYLRIKPDAPPQWDKTAHIFPAADPK